MSTGGEREPARGASVSPGDRVRHADEPGLGTGTVLRLAGERAVIDWDGGGSNELATISNLIPAASSEPAPTPAQPPTRQASPRRTMQGLSALPRGAFGGDSKNPTQPPPRPDEPDIEISVEDDG